MILGDHLVPVLAWLVVSTVTAAGESPRPHIVVILADDLGWNDVGFHGSDEIPTPNVDALAYHGVILNQHYTLPLCTPSRAALLTGKFPIKTGMQHLVILEDEPWGLGLEHKLLPELLREAGYSTHALGKWHLGFHKRQYTPTFRGFDSFLGYWQGYKDYYNHTIKPNYLPLEGLDLHRGLEPAWDLVGRYTTDLLTDEAVRVIEQHDKDRPMFMYLSHLAPHTGNPGDPFQAPDDTIAKFSHIDDLERRVYAAMVSKLDDSVGQVVSALRRRGMLENSVVLFMADNGGQTVGHHANRGSNHPLRGMKAMPWEGGTRGVAAVWSPLIKSTQTVSNGLIHLVDWLPTLAGLAGVPAQSYKGVDGLDVWSHIAEGSPSPRTSFVYNIDTIEHPYAAIRHNNWKYLLGTSLSQGNGWSGSTGRNVTPGYDVKAVLTSPTASALSGLMINTAIVENIRRTQGPVHSSIDKGAVRPGLVEESTVMRLRREAEVQCRGDGGVCLPLQGACLFDLLADPCEQDNLAASRPDLVLQLSRLLAQYESAVVPARNVPGDGLLRPELHNGTLWPWHDEPEDRAWSAAVLLLAGVVLVGLLAALLVLSVPTDQAKVSTKF